MKRIIVITGASAGVGRATAREFAREGAKIGLIARDQERLEATRREIEELGGQALVLPADADAIESAAAEEFKRVTEVTYLGYVHGSLSALRRMLPGDRGIIIQVGSALAYRGIPLQSAYCVALAFGVTSHQRRA